MKYINNHLYDRAFRKFSLGILCIVITSYIIGAFLYPLPFPINYFFLAGGIISATPFIIIFVIPTVYLKKIIKYYFAILIVPLYIMTVLCLLKAVVTPLFWLIVLPIYMYAIFPVNKTLKWLIGYIFLVISSVILTFVIQYVVYNNELVIYYSLSLYQSLLTELINGFFALLMICYSLYYIHIFHQIEIDSLVNPSDQAKIKETNISFYEEEEEYNEQKYEHIYEQIEYYLESKKPYLNADFRIAQMAFELNINVVYLAKAIKYKKDMNFNNLINYYRIEKSKKLIEDNASKYTIEYIYLSSGFKSQSSFNRAFKLHTGITPSEYYKTIENEE